MRNFPITDNEKYIKNNNVKIYQVEYNISLNMVSHTTDKLEKGENIDKCIEDLQFFSTMAGKYIEFIKNGK